MSKGISIEGFKGRYVVEGLSHEGDYYSPKVITLCRLPEPKPMPELKPGVMIEARSEASDRNSYYIIAEIEGDRIYVWCTGQSNFHDGLVFMNTVVATFDRDRERKEISRGRVPAKDLQGDRLLRQLS